eukprot:GDKI01039094.1.p1 GENE.GDKI01039094.1~~GDKI01039094.1.p1  ORF type:complete len:170 (-),score=44.81 GDKI01039094.1:29-538(-)
MDDYLKSGGIKTNLDIISTTPRSRSPTLQQKDELYLQGYGRQWGEKLTYSTGLAYGSGLMIGGGYGFLLGVRKGGATPKLFLNSILNSCATQGPALANQAGVITMFYVSFNNLISWARGQDDVINAAAAGALSGGLFKATTSWKAAAKYSVVSSAIFTGIDLAFREGYI